MAINVLLITLDQFRGDCLSIAGHPVVKTPNLDRLCERGVRLSRHYSQASPCSPGRASLYTGMYQMNHRVLANGTPLDKGFDNIALAARRAGYNPTLFGYTDQSIDPRVTTGADDPRLQTYEGILPGFDCALDLTRQMNPWRELLTKKGYDTSQGILQLLATENERPVDVSVSNFLATNLIDWIGTQDSAWFAHASFIRPHPPYSAAGEYSTMYAPDSVGQPIQRAEGLGGVLTTLISASEVKVRELLEIPEPWGVYAMVPLGYPMGKHGPLRRAPLSQMVKYDRWSD